MKVPERSQSLKDQFALRRLSGIRGCAGYPPILRERSLRAYCDKQEGECVYPATFAQSVLQDWEEKGEDPHVLLSECGSTSEFELAGKSDDIDDSVSLQ